LTFDWPAPVDASAMQETRALLLDWMDTCVVVRQPPSRVKSLKHKLATGPAQCEANLLCDFAIQ